MSKASHLAALGILVKHLDRDFFEACWLPIHLGRLDVSRAADSRNQSTRSVEDDTHGNSLGQPDHPVIITISGVAYSASIASLARVRHVLRAASCAVRRVRARKNEDFRESGRPSSPRPDLSGALPRMGNYTMLCRRAPGREIERCRNRQFTVFPQTPDHCCDCMISSCEVSARGAANIGFRFASAKAFSMTDSRPAFPS